MIGDDKNALPSGSGQAPGGSQIGSLMPVREPAGSPRQGNMPPKIEEGQEPPHDTVLPA